MTGKLTPLPAIRRVGDDASRAQVDHARYRRWISPGNGPTLDPRRDFRDSPTLDPRRRTGRHGSLSRSVDSALAHPPRRLDRRSTGWLTQWRDGWASESECHWAIAAPETNELLGRIAAKGVNLWDGTAELAYWVTPAARGRGLCTQAVTALSEWAFREVGFHRLELAHSIHNPRSCRVATKAGFSEEGVRRAPPGTPTAGTTCMSTPDYVAISLRHRPAPRAQVSDPPIPQLAAARPVRGRTEFGR